MIYPSYMLRHTYFDNFSPFIYMGLEITSIAVYSKCITKFGHACLRVCGCFGKVPNASTGGIPDQSLPSSSLRFTSNFRWIQ